GAEAALHAVVVDERLLHGSQSVRRADALDRRHLGAVDRGDWEEAGSARLAVDQNRARAAAALVASRLRARDPELLAQDVEQRGQKRAVRRVRDAVDADPHATSSRARWTSFGSTFRRYHADASASSPGSQSSSAASGLPARSTDVSRTACGPTPVAAMRNSSPALVAATASRV